ncbi:acyltransferase family protein [Microbacterium sp. NPDC016588]
MPSSAAAAAPPLTAPRRRRPSRAARIHRGGHTTPRALRLDVEGLRALAVMAVVLYHAQVPWMTGGFVGVDVFFVISGFLISGLIYDEIRKRGSFSFADFYARRARRILPAAAAVLAVVTIAAWVLMPPLRTTSVAVDALWAGFSLANWHFAASSTDYSHATALVSPLQHFWSLSVEEQFYLVWPLLLVIAGIVAVRLRLRRPIVPFYVVTLVALGASLAYSLYLTDANAPLAYLSTLTRVWQFALGTLAALLVRSFPIAKLPAWLRVALGFAGLAAVLWSVHAYDETTPYPGVAALIPSIGIALVLLMGRAVTPGVRSRGAWIDISAWLSIPPLRWLGGLSYSWYLWHWPLIVFTEFLVPDATWPLLVAVAAASLLPAYASYRLLENPVRHNRTVTRHPLQGLSIGLTACMLTVGVFVVVNGSVSRSLATSANISAVVGTAASTDDPFASDLTSGPVSPSVVNAISDLADHYNDCVVDQFATEATGCVITPDDALATGDVTADRYVLMGDSHAAQWISTVQALAADDDASTQVLSKIGCTVADVTAYADMLSRDYTECTQWRDSAISKLESEPAPRAIFISSLNRYGVDDTTLAAGWERSLARLTAIGVPVYYIVDTPFPSTDVPTCVSEHMDDWSACTIALDTAFRPDGLAQKTTDGSMPGVQSINLNAFLCPQADAATPTPCPMVRAGVMLYRDDSHITNTAARALIPYARAVLAEAREKQG